MKRFLVLLGCAWLAGGVAAADSFVQQLTPEERRAAGLDQLSAEQQAALDRLAERYAKEGSRQAVSEARAAVRAEVKAEVKAEVEHEVSKREESKFGLGEKAHAESIRSRIAGTFHGWDGHTVFTLENGQQWQQTDATDIYWLPPTTGPDVEIRQSGFGGGKLYLGPNGRWVRVRRVK